MFLERTLPLPSHTHIYTFSISQASVPIIRERPTLFFLLRGISYSKSVFISVVQIQEGIMI